MTGVNLKTVHEINLIQNGGGERQEFRSYDHTIISKKRKLFRRDESPPKRRIKAKRIWFLYWLSNWASYLETQVPSLPCSVKKKHLFVQLLVAELKVCVLVEWVVSLQNWLWWFYYDTKVVHFHLSDMSRDIDAYSVLFVIHWPMIRNTVHIYVIWICLIPHSHQQNMFC